MFYHICRSGANKAGLNFELEISKGYPEGLSSHGLNYLTDDNFADKDTKDIERIFEKIRASYYPDRPSRYKSIFACYSKENVRFWLQKFSNYPQAKVFQVHAEHFFIGDSKFLDPITGYSYDIELQAHRYWSKQLTDKPLLEVLLPLPVKIGAEFFL